MKVLIEQVNKSQEEELIIRCHEVDDDILELVNHVSNKGSVLLGYDGDKIFRIKYGDVYYFEAVDNRTFIYCKDHVYESKQKLYEVETLCEGRQFFRASKSSIINITKISFITPSLSGRFEAKLENNESVVVSRQYVPVLKRMLGL